MVETDNPDSCQGEIDPEVPHLIIDENVESCSNLDPDMDMPAVCVINDAPYWLVEEIKDVQVDPKGKLLYLVKWVGHSDDINSWEPEENCSLARRCIAEFHQRMSESKRNTLAQQLLAQSRAASDKSKRKSRKSSHPRRPKRTAVKKKNGSEESL